MDNVFKDYNVIPDIADMISLMVHQSYQKEINKRINILINFNSSYDYWLKSSRKIETPNNKYYIWEDIEYKDTKDLEPDEYIEMCNKHKIFNMNSNIRQSIFMEYCISRISNEIYEIEDEININEDEVEKLSNSIKIAKLDMLRRLFYLEYKSKEAQYLYIKSIKNNKISPKLRRRKQFKNNNTYLLHNA
jgi:hypothetical protein